MDKLKITVKEPEKPQEEKIEWRDLPIGTVYENAAETVLVKGEGRRLILLRYTSGNLWLEEAKIKSKDSWYEPAKILGQLTEIIVEKT